MHSSRCHGDELRLDSRFGSGIQMEERRRRGVEWDNWEEVREGGGGEWSGTIGRRGGGGYW